MNKLNIIGLLLLIFISSCRKDINDVTDNVTTDPPIILTYTPSVNNITGSVVGQVVNENNVPMPDVKIVMDGENYFTNEFGHFIIEEVTMNSHGQFVQAFQNATHFPGSRRFFPQEGKTSKVKIQMMQKEFNHEFSASEGGEIIMNGDAQVSFTPNSIKDSEGNIFQGTVLVASRWLDPSALTTYQEMPGNLQGVNFLSEEVALQTFGMMVVELESPSGEKLNIADGHSATITMPVPDDLLANTPEEIPLWSFNDEYGLWEEESVATLQNNTYVGEVEHFSFWNCDYPYPIVQVDVTFVDPNGATLNGYLVEVEIANGSSGTGYTQGDGTVYGMLPANEILTFKLYDGCGNVIFNQDLGPFTSTTSVGEVIVSNPNVNNTLIKGTLRDCDNNIVMNGLVIATMGGIPTYVYVTGGEFEFSMTSCSAIGEIQVYGVNMDNLQQGTTVTAFIQTTNELGDLSTCGAVLENYLAITIGSETKYVFDFVTNVQNGSTYFSSQAPNVFAGIGFGGDTVGDYGNDNFIEGLSFDGWDIYNATGSSTAFSTFTVTQFDTKLVGTFSGDVENNGVQVFVEGVFNLNL